MEAFVRFYGALNDFLPAARRRTTLVCRFDNRASIKDLIESLGVPHPEIDRLVVNGEFVDFRYVVAPGDRVAVYPPFHTLALGDAGQLVPPLSGDIRFVADVHLGRLAGYLRLAGFDTEYRNDAPDPALAEAAAAGDRILLTRDVDLLKRAIVRRGYFVRHTEPARQLVEILRRFECVAAAKPFTRCPACNRMLQPADKTQVADRVPPRTRECLDQFWECPGCSAVYWQGSHADRIQRFLDVAFAAARTAR
jgi:uncharacterized protein with PIN domain